MFQLSRNFHVISLRGEYQYTFVETPVNLLLQSYVEHYRKLHGSYQFTFVVWRFKLIRLLINTKSFIHIVLDSMKPCRES